MRAVIVYDGGGREDVTGRTVESIARTHFGKNATVRPIHSDLFNPPTTTWTVMEWKAQVNSYSVLGRIVTSNRGPGRPAKTSEGTSNVLVRRLPADVKAEIEAAAQAAGRTLSEEIAMRLTHPRG